MELASGIVEGVKHPTDKGFLHLWTCVSYRSLVIKNKSPAISLNKKGEFIVTMKYIF